MDDIIHVVEKTPQKVVFERSLTFLDGFFSASQLFQALRDSLMKTLPSDSKEYWLIKFCSRVTNSSMPLLHNPVAYQVLVDPLQAVRDPIKELHITSKLELLVYPSKPYFYRKRPDANEKPTGKT